MSLKASNMPQQWYCQIMGDEVGPLTSNQLREMALSGRLAPNDLIRKATSDRWVTAEQVKGLFDRATAPISPPTQVPAAVPQPRPPRRPAAPPATPKSRPLAIHRQIRGPIGFASENLMPGETILYAASIHPLIFFLPAILLLAFVIGIIMIWLGSDMIGPTLLLCGLFSSFFTIKAMIILLTTECVLTDRRVLGKTGLISRESIELLLSKVEGLQVKQSILGRLFGFGTVIVTGTGGLRNPFHGISQVLEFRKRVQEQIAGAPGS